jgi:pyruvate ferredoxin oxidoreductase gamma subunit
VSGIGSLPARGRSYGIRIESLGGLGADSASQALAAAAVVKLGWDAAHLPAGRLERKGARVRSFVRLSPLDQPLESTAKVDAIVVFHPALVRQRDTFAGLRADGLFLFNAPARTAPEELAALPAAARAIRIDAAGIAAKEKCAMDAAMLGALCGALGLLELEEFFCSDEPRRNAFRRGAKEIETLSEVGQAAGDLPSWDEAWTSGPQAGSGIWNDVSAARSGFLPAFNRERCIHCAMCDMVCPDLCLVWEEGEKGGRFQRELTGVDYRYCKGCLRCVETCPASAMLKKAETPGLAERLGVPLFPDLVS